MTDLTVISPPAGEALSLSEAKDFLRIGHDGEDDLVLGLIGAARAQLETASGLALVSRTLKRTWHQWGAGIQGRGAALRPGPVSGLVSVSLVERDETVTDVTGAFALKCGRLVLAPAGILPPLSNGRRAEIVFGAGFGPPEAVPEDLRYCLKRLVQVAYRRAGEADDSLPDDVTAMLARRRGVRL